MLVFVVLLAFTMLAVSPVAAQGPIVPQNPDLVVNAATSYVVDSLSGSVAVDIEYVIVNTSADVPVTEFEQRLPLAASDLVVKSGSQLLGAVRVGTSGDTGSWIIPLITVLRPGRSVDVSLAYTLRSDAPGGADSKIVINPAFVMLPVSASGSTAALHAVKVTLPPGFDVVDAPGFVAGESTESLELNDSGVLAPYSPVVVLAVDTAMLASSSLADLGVAVEVRAWPGHDGWSRRMSEAANSIVPQLAAWFGAPPMDAIEVIEGPLAAYPDTVVATPVNGTSTLVIDESADTGELGRQLTQAWIGVVLPEIPWFGPAAIDAFGTTAARLFDSEASGPDSTASGFNTDAHEVLDSFIAEIGGAKLASVVASVEAGEFTYPGPGAADADPLPADWHTLLDALRIKGGSIRTDNLFRQVLTDPAEASAIDQHAIALASFNKLVEQARGWPLPMWVRAPLAEWDFATFESRRSEAEATLVDSAALLEEGAVAGVDLGDYVKNSFGRGAGGMADTNALIADQRTGLEAVVETRRVIDANSGLLSRIGLIGTDVAARRSEIEGSFAAGRFEITRQLSDDLIRKIDSSSARGVLRVVIPSVLVAAIGFAAVEVVKRRRSWSVRRGKEALESGA